MNACIGTRATPLRRSKFYPLLAIIQSSSIYPGTGRVLRAAPPSTILPSPFFSSFFFFSFAHLSLPSSFLFPPHSASPSPPPLPARVVTYTFVTQRANIDKSVGTKTSEGIGTSHDTPGYQPSHTSPVRHAGVAISLHARVHNEIAGGKDEEGRMGTEKIVALRFVCARTVYKHFMKFE